MRTSAHNLMIERGRYIRPRISPDNRICSNCNSGEVEDELHFLINCTQYSKHRNTLYSNVRDGINNFDNLNDYDKFISLMSSQDFDVLLPLLKFTRDVFMEREASGM